MKWVNFLPVLFTTVFLVSACSSELVSRDPSSPEVEDAGQTALPDESTTQEIDLPEPENRRSDSPIPTLPEDEPSPAGAESEFITDFSKHSVPYSEILSGGPPKDGIPAIDEPKFIGVDEADEWLEAVEPIVFVQVEDDTRAYPLQILTWHEIVNDVVGDRPLVVTFCPLCNTAIAFERTVEGQMLNFGTTGRLRYSNLIMYDRQTETWWQQATGEAIIGELLGTKLKFHPTAIISWGWFRANYPEGKVLSRETGFSRSYGENPYAGYDDVNKPPFLYRGPETPGVLPPVARVLTVDLDGEAVAYPYDVLEKVRVINDTVAGQEIAIIWAPGTASALDSGLVAAGRDVGAANAYLRQTGDLDLTFRFEEGRILDDQTGSEWDVLGQAVGGELLGKQLEPVVAINHFWFSWAAFKPETRIYAP